MVEVRETGVQASRGRVRGDKLGERLMIIELMITFDVKTLNHSLIRLLIHK